MNSIDRKILRCQREIEASRPKVMSFEVFEKGDHNLALDKTGAIREVIDRSPTVWLYGSFNAHEFSCPKSYEGSGSGRVVLDNSKSFEYEAPPSVKLKVEEPKFRVGDRVRLTAKGIEHFTDMWAGEMVVDKLFPSSVGTRHATVGEASFPATYLELIPSPPTSDGWNGELVVGKVYLTTKGGVGKFFARWEGEWKYDSRDARVAASTAGCSYSQGRTVIREATEAELRGES